MKPERPWMITLLCLGMLVPILFHGLRVVQAVRQWDFLAALPLQVPPAYLAASGLGLSLVGLAAFWSLWRGHPWAARLFWPWALAMAGAVWYERLVLAVAPGGGANWPFALVLTILLLAFPAWALTRWKA